MYQFLKHTVLFSLITLCFVFLICEIKVSDHFIVYKTENTAYEKVAWNLNLINNQPKRIENSIVFFGPSLVQGGICDSTLNANDIKALNFGVNHFGNDLSLFFLKRIKHLKPKEVIFHKKKSSYSKLHKLTPLLYTPIELLKDGQRLNLYFLTYIFKRTALVFEYLSLTSFDRIDTSYVPNYHFGVRYEKATSYNILKPAKRDRTEMTNLHLNDFRFISERGNQSFSMKIKIYHRKWLHYLNYNSTLFNENSQENFVNKAFEICSANDFRFSKIYIPEVGDLKNLENHKQTFYMNSDSDKNVICFKNFHFLNDSIYWADIHHLNKKGAISFTEELVNNLKQSH
tara:strand:+ start:541 stop:1569 length:1029 start_codon:yes stop_codon:yes gene_type:complete